jgi:muramoyltetrapeptide carboxypeptidase
MAEKKIIIPAYLQKGDTIGIVCPAGFMPKEKANTCITTLQQWGYKVKIGKTLGGKSKNYFSGTDDERLKDLQQMLDDREVKAVLCGRGGYGMSRIIDRISFDHFRREPKWIIGFSDITILHAHVYSNYRIASLHAPMAAAFNDGGYRNKYIASLKDALAGKKANYIVKTHRLNRFGLVKAELVGGNLSLLAHLTGTRSGLNTRGKILFIEDVGEYLYHIDRMLQQLKRSGKLDGLAGLIVGGFTELKDTTRPYGKKVYEIIKEAVNEYHYPVCFGFPVSHEKENMALKIGVEYSLKISARTVALKESSSQ